MDKEEFRIKLDQINHLVEKGDYKGAMEVVDSIDWRRVKNVRTLCVVGEIYAANKRYEDSKEIFLLAYHRAPIGKNILCRLIEVSLKSGNIEEAMEYYEEYLQVAPNDSTKFILKYKIYKENNASDEELIKILEDYKEKEFTEKWSYELARLYYKIGEKEKCLGICNEIILWFSDGKYVMKAMDLKQKLGAMTKEEKEKFDQQFVPKLITKEQAQALKESEEEAEEALSDEEIDDDGEEAKEKEPVIESISMKDGNIAYSESIQDRISKGIRDIFNSKKKEAENKEESEEDAETEEMIEESLAELEEVPDLEEEDGSSKRNISLKMPELNISDSLKKVNKNDALKVPDIPKVANVELVEPKSKEEFEEEKEEDEDVDFNLEDTILAAASAQGIEIPGEKEEEDEDFMTEEDLRTAEEEFLNGPKKEKEEDNAEENSYLSESENAEEEIEEDHTYDLIPRKRELSEQEINLFSYLAKVPGMEAQIIDTLCDVQMAAVDKTSRTGNIIVMGGRETGKTRLISALIPAICSELHIGASKVAYVFADQINGKNIPEIVNKLSSGFLVIEEVNQLDKQTVDQLDKAMEFRTDGLTVIIEDEKIGMRKFLARNPKFAKKFTSMISIPVFTNDELVNFAKTYTKENGYIIDQMGMTALYSMIGKNQKEDEPMSIGVVKALLDEAIAKSQSGIRKFKRKKTGEDGLSILTEKDFV